MTRECPTCHLPIPNETLQRCPRCKTVLVKPPSCEDCSGCSFFKKCEQVQVEKPNKNPGDNHSIG